MKKTSKLLFLFVMANWQAISFAETVNIAPPKTAPSVVAPDAVNPGKDLKDLGGTGAMASKVSDCKFLSVSPLKIMLPSKELKTISISVNKPYCIKGILTSEPWVSVNKSELGVEILVEENDSPAYRSTEIILAGIEKGVGIEVVQSNLTKETPAPKKESILKQNDKQKKQE